MKTIQLSKLKWTMLSVNRTLDKQEYEQFARKIKKYLLKNYSILADIEVK